MNRAKIPELPDIRPDSEGYFDIMAVRRYNLCHLMIERGWTTEDLAIHYGCSQNAAYQFIVGKRNIGSVALARMAKCFEVSKEEFDLKPIPELHQAFRTLTGKRAEALKKFLALCQDEECGKVIPEVMDLVIDSLDRIKKISLK